MRNVFGLLMDAFGLLMDAFGRRSVDEDLSEAEEATALCGLIAKITSLAVARAMRFFCPFSAPES